MTSLRDLLWPRPGERLLPALSGVLLVLSFPPLHLLVPPFVALVPFAVWIHGLPADRRGSLAAVRGGLVLGIVYWGLLVYWILIALIWVSRLAILAYLLSVLILAGMVALTAWALHRALRRAGVALWLALPLAWTAGEWLRGHVPDLAFPWLGLGTALTGYPELAGAAELVGARGLTFWIVLANGVLATGILAWREGRRPLRHFVAALVVVALPMGWGVWRAGTLELRPVGRIAVVQPGIPEALKLDTRAALDSTRLSLGRLMPRVEPGTVELVVWPEVTFPTLLEEWPSLRRFTRARARAAEAPILLGALRHEGELPDDYVLFNSAFLVTPDQGLTDYRYDKRFLVPAVERVPWIEPGASSSFPRFGAYEEGRGWPLGETRNGFRFGTLICYESAFPEASRAYRRRGADFLVNMTNDAWYGREPWYARTTALWQHPAHMVMRAIENRVGVARAANTGISLFVDPLGRSYEATALFTPDLHTATVHTTDLTTLYVRLGDLAGTGSAAALLLLVLWPIRQGSRGRSGRVGEA